MTESCLLVHIFKTVFWTPLKFWLALEMPPLTGHYRLLSLRSTCSFQTLDAFHQVEHLPGPHLRCGARHGLGVP